MIFSKKLLLAIFFIIHMAAIDCSEKFKKDSIDIIQKTTALPNDVVGVIGSYIAPKIDDWISEFNTLDDTGKYYFFNYINNYLSEGSSLLEGYQLKTLKKYNQNLYNSLSFEMSRLDYIYAKFNNIEFEQHKKRSLATEQTKKDVESLKNQYLNQAKDLFLFYDYIYKLAKKNNFEGFSVLVFKPVKQLKAKIALRFIIR